MGEGGVNASHHLPELARQVVVGQPPPHPLNTRLGIAHPPRHDSDRPWGQRRVLHLLRQPCRRPTGRVHAFEPFPAAFTALEYEVARFRHRNVTLHNVAASDRPGLSRMYVNPDHSPSNSLHPVPGLTLDDGPVIEAVRLDDMRALHYPLHTKAVDVVKIDVEGHELHALRGMGCLLKDSRPVLFLEFNPSTLQAAGTKPRDVVSYLLGLGYRLYPIDERTGQVRLVESTGELMAALPPDGVLNLVARRV